MLLEQVADPARFRVTFTAPDLYTKFRLYQMVRDHGRYAHFEYKVVKWDEKTGKYQPVK